MEKFVKESVFRLFCPTGKLGTNLLKVMFAMFSFFAPSKFFFENWAKNEGQILINALFSVVSLSQKVVGQAWDSPGHNSRSLNRNDEFFENVTQYLLRFLGALA